jgi:hypothetical protein
MRRGHPVTPIFVSGVKRGGVCGRASGGGGGGGGAAGFAGGRAEAGAVYTTNLIVSRD